MPLALIVSLPLALLTSSEVLSCVHRADMSRYITWYVGEMPWNANLFQWEFWACWNRMSWSSLQDTDTGKLQDVCGKDKLEIKLNAVPLQPRSEEHLRHPYRWRLPWKITPPTAACLEGYSCEKCLSNNVPGFDPKKQTYFSIILSFFSNEISLLQLYSIIWDWDGLGMIVDPINTREAKDGA